MVEAMDIGFIGLGKMGHGMAANLINAGHTVTVYNRTSAKADELVDRAQGRRTASPKPAAAKSSSRCWPTTRQSKRWCSASTACWHRWRPVPHTSRRAPSAWTCPDGWRPPTAPPSSTYVAAPVFGRPEAAAAAKLFVVAGGAPQQLKALAPVFDAIGQRTFVVSDQQHAANLVKLTGNFLIASVIESLGEAIALVGKAGVDRQQYVDILTSTLFTAPVYQTYGGLIARRGIRAGGVRGDAGAQRRQVGAGRGGGVGGAAADRPACCATVFSRLLANGGGAPGLVGARYARRPRRRLPRGQTTPRSPSAPNTGSSIADSRGRGAADGRRRR